MYKTIRQILPKLGWFLLTISLFLTQNCIPKPNGSSLVDTSILANFISVSQTPIDLKVKVTGLTGGTLVLQSDNSDTLAITQNGTTKFSQQKAKYSDYSVTVVSQPNVSPSPAINCSISNPKGTLDPFFAYVEVVCAAKTYPVSLQVYGISSSVVGSLQVRSGAVDLLSITTDGAHTFSAEIPDQSGYSVQIISSPQAHVCQFETPPLPAGLIAAAPVVLNVNCLSVTNSIPVDQTVLRPSDFIDLTFSKNVTGCVLDGVNTPAGNLKFLQGPANITYPASNKVRVGSGGAWPTGTGLYVRLTGCIDPGTGKSYNNGTPFVFTYTVTNEVKYVTPTGLPAGLCDTVANACSSIRYAVSNCSAVPCFVLVATGTYSISDNATERIDLKDGVSLLGAFDSAFTQRNTNSFPTTIQDISPFGNCGAIEGNTCAAIFIGPPLANLTANIFVNQFTIKSNPNNPWSTGVFLNGVNTGANQAIIAGNVIQGTDSASAYTVGTVRSGIAAYGITPNINISYNYILGGSGNSASAGIYLNNSVGVIYANWLNGNSHLGATAGDFSTAIFARNLTAAQSLAITNNVINSYHLIGTPAVTAVNTSGIRTLNVNATNIHIIHNTIFGGIGTTDSFGINSLGLGIEHKIANNQIFANSSATNSICMNFTPAPGPTAEVKGNNLFNCTVLAKTPLFNFDLSCLGNPGPLRNAACTTDIASGANAQNFSAVPFFLPATGPLNYFQLGGGSTPSACTSVYGGLDPLYAPYLTLYQNDKNGTARTQNVTPAFPVPLGSFGYSIGAYEFNGVCQ
ncbi:hypothetical protein [Leptospira adleri]|uniref:Uncharacterized protein n=1 Tax=Leptospira adleri TaxID=2023186 RepID=A0A2M9YTH6_9LEPT|nr:hypothetical protein [Leptospira adleri]PJZ54842.1 hypothetical protein CH380_03795 [Leptospira adleri]PJZ61980.1 hypothetical protein CH376_10555 [Leptospira adleri]